MTAKDAALVPADPALEGAFISLLLQGWPPPPVVLPLTRLLSAESFTRPLWRRTWEAVVPTIQDGLQPDVVLVAATVGAEMKCGTADVLGEYAGAMRELGDGVDAWGRAQKLRELALRRELIRFGGDTAKLAYQDADVEGVMAYTLRVAEQMDAMTAAEEDGELRTVIDETEEQAETPEAIGWPTGFPVWDGWRRLHRGDIHVIGGASGVGKTWVCCQAAKTAAFAGHSVAFFSLEMTRKAMWIRLLSSSIGKVAFTLATGGKMWMPEDHERYKAAKEQWAAAPFRLYRSQRSVAQIAAVVRERKPDLIVVDYHQLLDWPAGCSSRYEAATRNATALQALASKADCAVVLATQMSRASLRETGSAIQGGADSGAIDQVADLWIYVAATENAGEFELSCRKNRHGPVGESRRYRMSGQGGIEAC